MYIVLRKVSERMKEQADAVGAESHMPLKPRNPDKRERDAIGKIRVWQEAVISENARRFKAVKKEPDRTGHQLNK